MSSNHGQLEIQTDSSLFVNEDDADLPAWRERNKEIEASLGAEKGVVKAGPVEVIAPLDMMQSVLRAASDPRTNIDTVERLLAMARDLENDRRKVEFSDALARVQAVMPQLDQNGKIDYNKPGVKPIPYALLEDIDRAIRPLYSAEGFSVSWNSKPVMDGKMVEVTGSFKHRYGHSESLSVTMPNDTSGAKSAIQAVVGTISYAKRTLLKMFFNLIERGTDLDGADLDPITQDQANDLRSLREEVKANGQKFLQFMRVARLEDILSKDYDKAVKALEAIRK